MPYDPPLCCGARTRRGGFCRKGALQHKQRCHLHGGHSTGARSLDGKERQREGYRRYVLRLRGQGRKPGPAKGKASRPRQAASLAEQHRRQIMVALQPQALRMKAPAMMADLTPPPDAAELQARLEALFAEPVPTKAGEPVLVVDNPAPVTLFAPPRPHLSLVPDASELAVEVEAIGQLAMARIKETLAKPFDPTDENYVALLKFVSSVYGSTMNTILRADENRLRQRTVDRLPELLQRVAAEEAKRAARTIEGSFDDAS